MRYLGQDANQESNLWVMKVVLDTNVLVSGFLWQGTPEELFILAEKNLITICVTQETLAEFERVLSYPKLRKHLVSPNFR